jgi:hypothetical protein
MKLPSSNQPTTSHKEKTRKIKHFRIWHYSIFEGEENRNRRSCEKEFVGVMGSEISDEFKEASKGMWNGQCVHF